MTGRARVAICALAAALAAGAVLMLAGSAVSALDRWIYEQWVDRLRPAPVSPDILVVMRDPASEERFGPGPWDRAALARVVTNLSRAGAAAVGIDTPVAEPSAPGRGGASSDALLAQAIADTGNVVVAAPTAAAPTGLDARVRALGHLELGPPDTDGVVRAVPVFRRLAGREVPALGLALALVPRNAGPHDIALSRRWVRTPATRPIPVDAEGRALPRFVDPQRLPAASFAEVWAAAAGGDAGTLQRLVADRIVLVLVEPATVRRPTPVGMLSPAAVQAQFLNAALTDSWLREPGRAWIAAFTFAGAFVAAWLPGTRRRGTAAAAIALFAAACVGTLLAGGGITRMRPPIAAPIAALVAAHATARLWTRAAARRQLEHLQSELHDIRDLLGRQESLVDALEEDLGARAEASAALRAQLADALRQEEATRRRVRELERQLQAAGAGSGALDDAELERLRRACAELGITTRDPGMLRLFRDLQKAARSALPILITGEPGTGKELFARAAHRLSERSAEPFVAVDMAAIPAELFESELFGHVKGGFTGAATDRKGYFEQADRGTIFLDEIGELRAEHQSKLLRVLQERSFYRVGAARPTTVDVRVIAASNRDLDRAVADGSFREDLYFRLKGLVLRLPPLRERRGDVRELAVRILDEAAAEVGRRVALSEAAMAALERYHWPGNVRELQHCLRQAAALADGEVLTVDDLRLPEPSATDDAAADDAAVLACLRQHRFDMQATARALGWDRSTVTQRLKGMGFRALVDSDGDYERAAAVIAGDPALAPTVELKLGDYHRRLLRTVDGFASAESALAACRRRFKNLPERHFRSLELLVRRHFEDSRR